VLTVQVDRYWTKSGQFTAQLMDHDGSTGEPK
jgi:hypothetical protein